MISCVFLQARRNLDGGGTTELPTDLDSPLPLICQQLRDSEEEKASMEKLFEQGSEVEFVLYRIVLYALVLPILTSPTLLQQWDSKRYYHYLNQKMQMFVFML